MAIEPESLAVAPGGAGDLALFERRGATVVLVDLARVLARPVPAEAPKQALVVRFGAELVAFGVDRVHGQQEAVVRPLADPLVQSQGVAGSTDLGDGRPTLVLDLIALGRRVQTAKKGKAA